MRESAIRMVNVVELLIVGLIVQTGVRPESALTSC